MYLKNIVERSKNVKINEKYDMSSKNMEELLEEYGNKPIELMVASFRIGYLQGSKAEKAKRRHNNGKKEES